jgi:hypothetical protein
MKKLFAIIALALCVITAQASTLDTSKLTPEQVATLTKQAQEMASQPVNVSVTVRKEAEAWGELGANMGKAMVGAAKEVGVAANEFSQTPLGQVVVFMAAYKIIGQDMLSVIIGLSILIFGYSVALWVAMSKRWSDVKYEYDTIFWGIWKRKRLISINTDSDTVVAKVLAAGTLLFASSVVGLNIIF